MIHPLVPFTMYVTAMCVNTSTHMVFMCYEPWLGTRTGAEKERFENKVIHVDFKKRKVVNGLPVR